MKQRLLTYLSAAMLLLPSGLAAAEPETIVGHIESTSSNRVIQSPAIGQLLRPGNPAEPASSSAPQEQSDDDDSKSANNEQTPASTPSASSAKKIVGYRVQVFSDNNARTAKNEARSKSRNISAKFPQYRTYVIYNSPYWRLKVGDFRTQGEAEEAAAELRKAFPSYSKEIRVVRDKITVY